MKKFLKRTLSVFLTIVMLLTAAPLSGFVGMDLPYLKGVFWDDVKALETSGQCGDNAFWKVDEEKGELSITGSGAIYDYDIVKAPWYHVFPWDYWIKTIKISEGITQIGQFAFYGTSQLEKVYLPSTLTHIGYGSFEECDSLTNIMLPESLTLINSRAFRGCDNLDEVTFPENLKAVGYEAFKDSGVKYVKTNQNLVDMYGSAFSNCENLQVVDWVASSANIVVGGKTAVFYESGKNVGGITFNIKSTVEVFDVIKIVGENENTIRSFVVDSDNKFFSSDSFGALFDKEKSVLLKFPSLSDSTSYTVPNSVETIDFSAFANNYNLTKIIIGDEVKMISESAFLGCKNLKDVDFGNSVTVIGDGAFLNAGIVNLNIPDSVLEIGYRAFVGCSSIETISIGKNIDNLSGLSFNYYTKLKYIEVDIENQYYSSDLSGVLYSKDKTNLIQYPIGNDRKSFLIPDGVNKIERDAFRKVESLLEIIIPSTINRIENGAFDDCINLSKISISDNCKFNYIHSKVFDDTQYYTESKNWSDQALYVGKHLIKVKADVSGSFTVVRETKTIASDAFELCENLNSITIPDSVVYVGVLSSSYIKDIYYMSTEAQWKAVCVEADNIQWHGNINVHFNSAGSSLGGGADDSTYLYNLYAFSSKPQLIMGTSNAIEMTFEIDCYDWENPAYLLSSPTFSFTASDTNIFSIEKIENRNGRTYVTITGENPGTAFLGVTGYNNGKYVAGGQFMVTVTGETVYHADAIPKFDDYNIIANSIIIDNYKCTNTGTETCNISFDAYNTLNCFGSVELYDSSNNLLESYCIDRFDLGLPTGLWDTVKQAFDVSDLKDRTYKNEEYSTKTEIKLIAVPRDGHIVISNDPSASTVCAAYNLSYLVADICCEAVSLAMPSGSADEVSDNIAKAIAKETIETLFGNKAMLKKFESFTKDFLTGANCGSRESVDENVKFYSVFLSEIGVDIGDIAIEVFKESLKDLPGDLIETAVYSVFGAAGAIMKTGFKFISFADTADMIETLSENYGVGNTSIYCSKPWNEQLYSNGYMVTNRELFDENISFHQYKIVDDDTYDKATNTFGDERYIDIIEMSLYKNGVKQQPQGDVEVAMPLPKGISFMDVDVYRMEEDGSYTKIPCRVEDGYIYITTNHFSVYCIVGDKIDIEYMYFQEDYIQVDLNDSVTNELTIYPSDSVEVELVWSSSDESIAVVTPMGNVVGISPGIVEIYASTKDGECYASYTLEVVNSIFVELNMDYISMNYKDSTTITPTIDIDEEVNNTVKYSSSDSSVATVDENGNIVATGTGSATITCTVTDEYGNVVTDTCEVNVSYSWWQWIIVIVLFGWIWY